MLDDKNQLVNGLKLFASLNQSCGYNIKIAYDIIVIGSDNEVYKIFNTIEYTLKSGERYLQKTLLYTHEDTVVWPENLKDNPTVIFSLKEIIN